MFKGVARHDAYSAPLQIQVVLLPVQTADDCVNAARGTWVKKGWRRHTYLHMPCSKAGIAKYQA